MFITIHRAIVKQTYHRRGSTVQICPAVLFYLCLQRVKTLGTIRWIRVDLDKDHLLNFYAKQNKIQTVTDNAVRRLRSFHLHLE